jgi:5-methylcytosine-specific restriction endonuclease McrA
MEQALVERNRRYQAAYRERHRDEINTRKKERYYAHAQEICAKNAAYRSENYERRLEIERDSRAKNKDKWRPAKNARQSVRNRALKEDQFVILTKELQRVYRDSCYNCGSMENQTLDHLIPLSKGGRHSVGNIGTLCSSCNSSKHARTITEWKHSKRMLGVG